MGNDLSTSNLLKRCEQIYDALQERSTTRFVAFDGEDRWMPVYEGFITHLFSEVGMPGSYYPIVMRELYEQDCLAKIARGGGTSPSVVALLHRPTAEGFGALGTRATGPRRQVRFWEQRLADHEDRIDRLEKRLGVPRG